MLSPASGGAGLRLWLSVHAWGQGDGLSYAQARLESPGQLVHQDTVWRPLQRLYQRLQTLSSGRDRGDATAHLPPFQSHRGDAVEGYCARLLLRRGAHWLDKPENRYFQTQNQGDGEPISVHCAVPVAGEISCP